MPPTAYPLRPTRPTPWSPMTDAQWEALAAFVLPLRPRGGRPPRNSRRLWDGIFWVVSGRHPWHAMPAEFGKPDTASRTLRRLQRQGVLDRLLLAISPHPLANGDGLDGMAWRIVRAWRRVSRKASWAQLALAVRLGMQSALPCHPLDLPRPGLSGLIMKMSRLIPTLRPQTRIPFLRTLRKICLDCGGQYRNWRTR